MVIYLYDRYCDSVWTFNHVYDYMYVDRQKDVMPWICPPKIWLSKVDGTKYDNTCIHPWSWAMGLCQRQNSTEKTEPLG